DTIRPTASGSGSFYDEGPVGDPDYSVIRQAGDYRRVFAAITPQMTLGYGSLETFFGAESASASLAAPAGKPALQQTQRVDPSVMPEHPVVQRYQAQRPGPEVFQARQRVLSHGVGAVDNGEPLPVVLLGEYWHELRERVEYGTIPPRAALSVSTARTVVGRPVAFADESVDDDGTLTQWLWDFGDGTVSMERNPTHTYAEAGQYVVSLVVTDDAGAQSYPVYEAITVANRPVAVAGPDRYGAVNSPILLDGSASYDPDEGESVTGYEWTVVDRPVGAAGEIQPLGDPAAKVHLIVDRPGEYRVRLVGTDSVGEESEPDEVRVVVVQTYVAPNPARHEATFYYDADLAGGTLRIFNVAGRLVRTLALEADGSTTWDLTDAGGRPLASGLYLWVLLDQDGRPVTERPERLVIQR
ncbi:MAG: PKD domain-containing protein, partial [Firmicutes bacterium]|nr:PKD domain-containing protein [Bacillota bacterium]